MNGSDIDRLGWDTEESLNLTVLIFLCEVGGKVLGEKELRAVPTESSEGWH